MSIAKTSGPPQSIRRLKWRLDPLLDRLGYKLERKGDGSIPFLTRLLEDRLRSPRQVVFVQIGANDGVTSDPLYPLIKANPEKFRGIVVEPLPDKFALLTQAYAGIDSVVPVNLAVHNTRREMQIHRVRPDLEKTLPGWARGLGSFNADHHKRARLDSSVMVSETVTCTSFDELLATHGLSQVELLITDTEGYDFEILRNVDFTRYRPAYIQFEHGLHSNVMTWDNYKELVRHLASHGYSISHETSDATAFLPAALDAS